MTASIPAADVTLTALFATAGLAFGAGYFAILRRTVDVYASGRRWLVPAVLTFTRIAGAIVFFAFIAQIGALPMLAAFLGFLGARGLALSVARRVA